MSEMRKLIMIVEGHTDTTDNNWVKISGPTVDVTGDDLVDITAHYNARNKTVIPGTFEGERDTVIYTNDDGSIKVECKPVWYASVGSTESITVYQRA